MALDIWEQNYGARWVGADDMFWIQRLAFVLIGIFLESKAINQLSRAHIGCRNAEMLVRGGLIVK